MISHNVLMAPVGSLPIDESQRGRAYDVVFDEAGFGSGWLGVS